MDHTFIETRYRSFLKENNTHLFFKSTIPNFFFLTVFILVNISIPSNYFVYGSDVTLTSTMVSEVPVSTIKWQRMSSMGTFTNLDLSKHKYLQTNVGSDIVTLTIIGLTFQDEGIYRVQVNNSAGINNSSNQIPLKITGGTSYFIIISLY